MRSALLALVLLATLAPAAAAQDPDLPDLDLPPPETEPAPSIEVVGQAELTARDDAAVLPIRIAARRSTEAGAIVAISRKQDRLIAKLHAAGLPDRDMRVQRLRVTRFHVNGRVTRAVVRTGIRATIHNLRRMRRVTAAASSAGATPGEPKFFLSDPKALYERALLEAFDAAEAKAQTLADRADLFLGEAISMREGPPGDPVAVGERVSRVEATLTVEFALEEF